MPEKIEPILKLPKEMERDLEKTKEDIEKAEHALQVLKKLGMETGPLEEKLLWSKNVRETLLKEFT